jgi:hypothetical protein
MADHGVKDKVIAGARGADADLDHAIEYYLEEDDAEEEAEYEDYDDEEDN